MGLGGGDVDVFQKGLKKGMGGKSTQKGSIKYRWRNNALLEGTITSVTHMKSKGGELFVSVEEGRENRRREKMELARVGKNDSSRCQVTTRLLSKKTET